MLRRSSLLRVVLLLCSLPILSVDAFLGGFGTISLSLGRAIAPNQPPPPLSSLPTLRVVQHPSFRLLAKASDEDATQKFLSNWMEKNEWFSTPMTRVRQSSSRNNNNNNKHRAGPPFNRGRIPPPLPPRILLHGLPLSTTWQQIKDHCQQVCNEPALFVQLNHPNTTTTIPASTTSTDDTDTNNPTMNITRSAALQFKTKSQATRAFAALCNHTINDQLPQVSWEEPQSSSSSSSHVDRKEYSIWRCASMDRGASIPTTEWDGIQQLMQERQAARKRRDFPVADRIRETLKSTYQVMMDDRTMLWWMESDAATASASESQLGGERWAPWRRIPTNPQHDRVVEETVVATLLEQRDQARIRKDFKTADALLDQVEHSSCASDKYVIRVHDPTRTWRVWILNRTTTTMKQWSGKPQRPQQRAASYPKNNTTRTD